MDFLLIALLTLLNGVFAMSELALASSRKARLAAMAQTGDKGAQRSDDLRFVALILPGSGDVGSVLNLKFVQVSSVGVPVLNRAKAEVVLTQPELYAYVFSRID